VCVCLCECEFVCVCVCVCVCECVSNFAESTNLTNEARIGLLSRRKRNDTHH